MNPSEFARINNMRRIKAADNAHKNRVRSARKAGYRGPLTRNEASRMRPTPVVMLKGTVR